MEIAGASLVHVSPDGSGFAVLMDNAGEFSVNVNHVTFGPYSETDLETISPFEDSADLWSFRARKASGLFVNVQGKEFGPFQEVHRVASAGGHWGCLVKSDDHYRVLIDGVLGDPFEAVVGKHQAVDFDLRTTDTADVPLFYGQGRWVYLARMGAAKTIVTDRGAFGPYSILGDFDLESTPVPVSPMIERSLCLDRSTFALGVAKKEDGGPETFFFWRDGTESGPFPSLPDFLGLRDMSVDGSSWAFRCDGTIVTHQGTTARTRPSAPTISDTNSVIAYTHGNEGDTRVVVGPEEFGPVVFATVPSMSPDGSRWGFAFRSLADGKAYLRTESGLTGPFFAVLGVGFLGDQHVAAIGEADGPVSLRIEEDVYGPYASVTFTPPLMASANDKSTDKSWNAIGIGAGQIFDIFASGTRLGSLSPFETVSALRAKPPNWSATARSGEKTFLVENGRVSDGLGPFKRFLGVFRSEDTSRIALIAHDQSDQHLVVFADRTLGPFELRPGPVGFSADGTHWGFVARPADSKVRMIHDLGESQDFDAIRDVTIGERGATFVGIVDGKSRIVIGNDVHGPFDAAGLLVRSTGVTAVVVENGTVRRLEL